MLYGGVLSLPQEQREMMDVIWRGAFIATRTEGDDDVIWRGTFIATRTEGDDGCYMEGCFHCHKNIGR